MVVYMNMHEGWIVHGLSFWTGAGYPSIHTINNHCMHLNLIYQCIMIYSNMHMYILGRLLEFHRSIMIRG
jgi:hypothetical protein